jgi:acetoin utilization deacetylase AcuC-like enzyme
MNERKKIAIITDSGFTYMHEPPFPKPSFISYENPKRISSILRELKKRGIFEKSNIERIYPLKIMLNDLLLAHSRYHVESIKGISRLGGGLISDEVFITKNTFRLAKKAVGGAVQALKVVVEGKFEHSIALVRPPGHHALREAASGLCIFNNIAIAILYLRQKLNFQGKIAIVDIDNHFGDGLARYFYEDPTVLYFSIHEFDYQSGDLGMIKEVGDGLGKGTNINYPLPPGLTNSEFLSLFDIIEPILVDYQPELIIVAMGFDMYFADPIGNNDLTSDAYYQFSNRIKKLSLKLCDGKLAFILEGGYSLIGLPYCTLAIIKALLNEKYQVPEFEDFPISKNLREEIKKIKYTLLHLFAGYWKTLDLNK